MMLTEGADSLNKCMITAEKSVHFRNSLLSFCNNYKNVYIYGAGKRGRKLYLALRLTELSIHGFIITEGSHNKLFGLPVRSVSDTIFEERSGVVVSFRDADKKNIHSLIGERADIFFIPDNIYQYLIKTLTIDSIIKHFNVSPCYELKPPSKWNNILIIRLDVIGDLIMTTPFIRELRRNCPSSHITLVVNKDMEMLFRHCPYISELVLFEAAETIISEQTEISLSCLKEKMERFASQQLKSRHYDIAFLPRQLLTGRNSIEEALLLSTSTADMRVCRVKSHIQNDTISSLFSTIYCETAEHHEVEYMLDMLVHCGCSIKDAATEIWIGEQERYFAQAVLETFKYPYYIAVGLTGRNVPKKNWTAENYQKFICRMIELYGNTFAFILFGDKEASLTANKILQTAGNAKCHIRDLTGRTTLSQALSVMKTCCLYVGAETGVKHMAAAVRLPVVELSCALPDSTIDDESDPRRYGAWGVPRIVLKPPKGLDNCKGSCLKNYPHCIMQITVDEVIAATRNLLSTTQSMHDQG